MYLQEKMGPETDFRDAGAESSRALHRLLRVGAEIAAELNIDRVVQVVTDAATELTGAAYGSFFYNVTDERGES
ncbi:MAG: hypothetical protein JO348_07860, partial [Alphaproteobacteria bacterium]|nr:hypothetical protein [Alphaproteobacteria bacterium]